MMRTTFRREGKKKPFGFEKQGGEEKREKPTNRSPPSGVKSCPRECSQVVRDDYFGEGWMGGEFLGGGKKKETARPRPYGA